MAAIRIMQFTVAAICVSACASPGASDDANEGATNFSSASETVLTYCTASDFQTIQRSFHDGAKLEPSIAKRVWSTCRIVQVTKARLANGSVNARLGDMEVVTEVRMIDPLRDNPLTRFWYLVRQYGDEWKIVSNSHIPDENYPPLD